MKRSVVRQRNEKEKEIKESLLPKEWRILLGDFVKKVLSHPSLAWTCLLILE
jgi:hypothetical protein